MSYVLGSVIPEVSRTFTHFLYRYRSNNPGLLSDIEEIDADAKMNVSIKKTKKRSDYHQRPIPPLG